MPILWIHNRCFFLFLKYSIPPFFFHSIECMCTCSEYIKGFTFWEHFVWAFRCVLYAKSFCIYFSTVKLWFKICTASMNGICPWIYLYWFIIFFFLSINPIWMLWSEADCNFLVVRLRFRYYRALVRGFHRKHVHLSYEQHTIFVWKS